MGNANHYNSKFEIILPFHCLLSILPVSIGDTLATSKINQSVQLYSLLGQTEGGRKACFWRGQGEGERVKRESTPKSSCLLYKIKKVFPFVKFEIILPFLCYSIDPLTIRRNELFDKFFGQIL